MGVNRHRDALGFSLGLRGRVLASAKPVEAAARALTD
jgi:hypothetical protein